VNSTGYTGRNAPVNATSKAIRTLRIIGEWDPPETQPLF
jgi:hypothetical protein